MLALSPRLTGRLTLAVFLSVSLLGQGLHCLSGRGHSCSHLHGHLHPHVHPHANCAHGHEPHAHGHAVTATDAVAALDDDCEICRLLAKSQLVTAWNLRPSEADACEILSDALPLRISSPILRQHPARAPPLS
jgi:hypothetical protein